MNVDHGICWSEGARLLTLELRRREMTQGQAERLIGSPQGMLNRWVLGKRRPGLKFAIVLHEAFGIPLDAWHSAAKSSRTKKRAA